VGDRGSGGPCGVTAVVEIRLLGGFDLFVDGKPVPTGSWRLRKARDVVKILALAPGHRRHRDEVIEALWPERDADSGLNNLHQALHIARRGLAGEPAADSGTSGSGTRSAGRGRLRVRDEWVALCPDELLRVDVEEFEAAATVAEGSDDPACMEQALSEYPGDLLPEDRYEDWATARRDELSARRRRLVTRLAALREAAGDPQAAVDLLAPLAADDPTDEVAQRALIRGYALAGDRGAALRQYQVLADALRDTLAVPPDGPTEQLHREVLAGRLGGAGAGKPPQAAGVPRQRTATHRRERPRPGLPAGHNLPIRLSTFVGREHALAELSAMLGQRRLITLLGTGGCGKSRLAVEVAQRAVAQFPDGVWLTELAAASGTGDDAVGRALARDLAIGEQSGQSPLAAVAAALAGQRSLLVIDNCEYRIEAAARAVAGLLAASQDLVVLATSREPLRVPGEALWQVPSLTMPDPHRPASVPELRHCESVRLFTDRAMAADPGFRLDADNAAAVAEICFRLDGLPLAIELAAARVPALGTRGIAERLDDRFRLLTGGSRTALNRQRTLAATFDWSYELLSEPEQAAFRRVSVFAETFSLPAAAAVAAGGEVERDNMAVVLPDLVARSMVAIEHEALTFRYRLIETLREYGRARLGETGELAAVRRRHAAWFLTLAREAAEHFADPGRRRWLERVDADQADLQAALSTLTDTDPARALALAGALWPYWGMRGSFGEGLGRLHTALRAETEPSPTRVEALVGAFALKLRWAGAGEDNPYAGQALAQARELGDPAAIARAGFFVGVQAWMREDYQAARTELLAATATARAHGMLMAQASTVHALACVAWSQRQTGLARRRLREALALARRGAADGDPGSFWQVTMGAIVTARWLGAPRLVYEDSYVPFQENRGPSAVAFIRASMGSLARSEGDPEAARRLFQEALALFEEAGDEAGVALALGRLGNLAATVGQEAPAREYLIRSLDIRRELRDQRCIGIALMSLGRLEVAAGRLDSAIDLFVEATGVFRASGDRPAMVGAVTRLGELQIAVARRDRGRNGRAGRDGRDGRDGQPGPDAADAGGEAVRLLEAAADSLRAIGNRPHLGLALTALAEAYDITGGQELAGQAAREAIALLAYAPAEPGREQAVRRLSEIAGR
jgi:predicted ATPase/DNA-binding SARP family transcriptional activator